MDERESRKRHGHSKLRGLSLAAVLLGASPLGAQPSIEFQDVDCLPRGEFTRFLASIQPASTIRTAKIYFRSSLFPEFYFVVMNLDEAGSFEAVLPIPAAETSKVVYYFEAVDVSFQIARSEELEVAVSGDESCQRGPGALLYPGANPAIVVGATQVGSAAIPAGFQAAGITGFLTTTGAITAAGGGGIGIGVAVGAVAAAAAGVGVIVVGGGAGDSAGVTTTAPPPLGGGNTSSTSTAISSTTTTVIGAPATTTTGPSTSSVVTNTVPPPPPPTTTSVPALTACFESRAVGGCLVDFNSCSTPLELITGYEWRMLGPPVPASPPPIPAFQFDFEGDPRCEGTMSFNHPVRLTVFDDLGRSASVQQNVIVLPGMTYRTDDAASASLSFQSRLLALPADGSAQGQIMVNGAVLPPSDDRSAARHEVQVGTGIVRIQAVLTTAVGPGSLWELDFSTSESLVSGSLRAEAGSVVGLEERRIVFRLSGDRGETFRLRLAVR